MAVKRTKRSKSQAQSIGDAFAEVGRAPRHRLPDNEMDPEVAYQIVHDELMLDGNARLNLATFVGTWVEPQALRLMTETFDKNMINKDEYPQTAEMEMRCVDMISRLGQVLLVTPDDPADARSHQAVLVAGRVDRHHALQTEVPVQLRVQERGDEAARRRVHVDRDVQPGLLLELVQRPADLPRGDDLPVFAFKVRDDIMNFNVFDVSNAVRERGWQVPAYTFPTNREDLAVLRAVVKRGFTHDVAGLFVNDLKRQLPCLERQPIPVIDRESGSGFRH